MHELGIPRDLWDIIKHTASEHNLKTIDKIVIAVGETSGIDAEFLRHSFEDHIFKEFKLTDTKLDIIMEKISAVCNNCKHKINKEDIVSIYCPHCGGMNIDILSGKEVYVKNVEGDKS